MSEAITLAPSPEYRMGEALPLRAAPSDDLWEIPTFLRLTAEERAASWCGRKLTSGQRDTTGTAKPIRWDLPRTIDAAGLALLRQLEKERAERACESRPFCRELIKAGASNTAIAPAFDCRAPRRFTKPR
jgi:hypothetical protein